MPSYTHICVVFTVAEQKRSTRSQEEDADHPGEDEWTDWLDTQKQKETTFTAKRYIKYLYDYVVMARGWIRLGGVCFSRQG